ncbi:MAG: glycosyltransferase family 4 protein [Candidatus Saccharibacteria bacterium]|nr:glycosyltransferase family 4 protein [Candidatus Saccharibacteria bacterium]
MKKITVNMASESDISVQGHGVHTAYEELLSALEKRNDVQVIRGGFRRNVECDVYHLHTIGLHMWRKIFDRSAKKVVSAHVIPDSFIGSIILAKYWRFAAVWYMRWFYNRADKVLAVSKTVAEVLHKELKVPNEKIEVLYNTIDMAQYTTTADERLAARTQLRFAVDDFLVVGVGQVQPRKRLDSFVAMARALPDVQFVWVGGIPFGQLGADYKAMQKLIESTPDNLHITDVIPHEKVKRYLQAADVFCLPAEQENHPMCVLEAAGASLPIVVRDIPEYNDTFANDVLRCRTDEEFIAAVAKLQSSAATRKQWKAKSKKIAKRFDSKVAASQLMSLYRDLLKEDAR